MSTVQRFDDAFALAPAPQAVLERLIADVDGFVHILSAKPRIAAVFSEQAVMLRGATCAACIGGGPIVQGPARNLVYWAIALFLKPLFEGEDPDFLVLIDRPVWDGLDAERQERLMFHELSHIQAKEDEYGCPVLDRDGRPVLKVVPHDVEVFHAEIERYGVDVCNLEDAAVAIAEGERRRRDRDEDPARARAVSDVA